MCMYDTRVHIDIFLYLQKYRDASRLIDLVIKYTINVAHSTKLVIACGKTIFLQRIDDEDAVLRDATRRDTAFVRIFEISFFFGRVSISGARLRSCIIVNFLRKEN